jgi:hypothetical protein
MSFSLSSRFSPARGLLGVAAALVFAWAPAVAHAQLNSTAQAVTLNATLAESLTVQATGSPVTLTLQPNAVSNTGSVTITSTWTTAPSRANVTLYGWFGSATQALSDGATTPDYIPTSAIYGMDTNNGSSTAWTSFSSSTTPGVSGASLQIYRATLNSGNRSSNRTDTLGLQVNLSSLPNTPAGTYTGTLNLQAVAQ